MVNLLRRREWHEQRLSSGYLGQNTSIPVSNPDYNGIASISHLDVNDVTTSIGVKVAGVS